MKKESAKGNYGLGGGRGVIRIKNKEGKRG